MRLTNAKDVYVDGSRPVKIAEARKNRKAINIWAGDTNLWYGGNRDVIAGTIGHKILNGQRIEIETGAEIWVIRAANTSGNCSVSEEFKDG